MSSLSESQRYIKDLLAARDARVRELEDQRTDLIRKMAVAIKPRNKQLEVMRMRLHEEMNRRIAAEFRAARAERTLNTLLHDSIRAGGNGLRHWTTKAAEEDGD